MILRLWRARLRAGTEPEFLERLRAAAADAERTGDGPIDYRYGFRPDGGQTGFLSLSVWPDFGAVVDQTGGDVSRSIQRISLEDLCDWTEAGTYERLPPAPATVDLSEGRVLGTVVGRVKQNHEASVQAMVDASVESALAAGALAMHVGRRLDRDSVEIAIVAVWPDRRVLGGFARSRGFGAIDPRFTDQLTAWRFETYDALARERLLVPSAGPAILVSDAEGRCIEASPGVERLLGLPGEILLGRAMTEVIDGAAPSADGAGPADGATPADGGTRDGRAAAPIELRGPDGTLVGLRVRVISNVPSPGLHAWILESEDAEPDPRPVAEVVADAFPAWTGVPTTA
jgi:PAS domain-containing protein